jgi:Papain-like cysteine protease AvrRpt2
MRLRQGWCAAGLLLLVTGCVCNRPPISSLPVTLHAQETSMWCWAASGQMVMHYLGHNVSQCVEANNRFNRSDCPCTQCTNPVSNPPCVEGGWPEFGKYGFTFLTTSNAPLTWDQLRREVANARYCGKRPFAFSWHWPGGGGHMMVVNGYVTVEGTNYVAILDPWAPCQGDTRIITYDFYNTSPGDHTHWDDYYNVRYTGGS